MLFRWIGKVFPTSSSNRVKDCLVPSVLQHTTLNHLKLSSAESERIPCNPKCPRSWISSSSTSCCGSLTSRSHQGWRRAGWTSPGSRGGRGGPRRSPPAPSASRWWWRGRPTPLRGFHRRSTPLACFHIHPCQSLDERRKCNKFGNIDLTCLWVSLRVSQHEFYNLGPIPHYNTPTETALNITCISWPPSWAYPLHSDQSLQWSQSQTQPPGSPGRCTL